MPADTYSSTLGFLQMQPGNDNNTWGALANSGVFTIFENAIAGGLAVTMTAGATNTSLVTTLPPSGPSSAGYGILQLTGTGGAVGINNTTLQVPNLTMKWVIYNASTGDVLLKTPAGTAICIPVGTHKYVWCDGANNLYRHDRDDVGEIKSFGYAGIPPGFFEASGALVSQTLYPDLYTKYGTTWGAGGATTFQLPLLTDTGRYLRSRLAGTTEAGTYQANQFAQHKHTLTDPGHTHTITDPGHTHNVSDPGHIHSLTDPGHVHGPGSGSSFVYNGAPFQYSLGSGSGSFGNTNTTTSATTGISVSSHTTGVTVNSHVTNVTNVAATTGITMANAGSGTETRPETAIVRMAVRY